MHGLSLAATTFLGVIWATAFAASMARSLYDPRTRSFGRVLSSAATSGFVAISAVGSVCGDINSADFNSVHYIAVAAGLGASGKEQNKYAKAMVLGGLKGIGIAISDTTKNE